MASQPLPLSKIVASETPTMLHSSLTNIDHDEIVIADQVMATHDPSGGKDFNAILVLDFAENILNFNMDLGKVEKDMQKLQESELPQIKQLSFEVAFKSLRYANCHLAAIHLLSMLSTYPWEAKVVMMLVALALICGEFMTISRHSHHIRLASKLALLKQNLIATPSHHIEKLVDDSIIKSIVDLAKCVVELNQPLSSSPPQSLILATYWIARGVLTYPQHIFGAESQNKEKEESTLIDKTKSILSTCHRLLEIRRAEKSYEVLLDALCNSSNNLDVLKLIFHEKDENNEKCFLGWDDFKYGVDFLGNQRLLLIVMSGTNVSEVAFLSRHLRAIRVGIRIIWIPIVDDIELWTVQNKHSHLKNVCYGSMVWDPHKRITAQFIRFVKERCIPAFQSDGEPIVISLDNRGRLVHTNALHMILTWRRDLIRETVTIREGGNIIPFLKKELTEMSLGVVSVIGDMEKRIGDLIGDINKKINDWRRDINAKVDYSDSSYNYTSKREKELWDKETWSLKLLVCKEYWIKNFLIDKEITDWIDKGYFIFLYGGNDANCIQKFATVVKEVNSKGPLDMKLAYVRKSKKVKSMVENMIDYALSSEEEYWWFWTRLRSVFISRINYLANVGHDEGEDKIIQGLQKLLAYEAKGTTVGGWALLSKGEEVIVCDSGDKMLRVMNEYQEWKDNMHNKGGFSQAFKDCYKTLASFSFSKDCHPYCALECPSILDKIPKNVKCPQCSRNMHKFVTFTCCHDNDIWD